MNNEHPISDEVLEKVTDALANGEQWMAYNGSLYFLDKEDVYFFKDHDEAIEFAKNNISDRDQFNVIKISSVENLLERVARDKIFTSIPQNDKEANISELIKQLDQLGFAKRLEPALRFYIEYDFNSFTIPHWLEQGKDTMRSLLHFEKDDHTGKYILAQYEAVLKKDFSILEMNINGINTKELEQNIAKVDWKIDHYLDALLEYSSTTKEGRAQMKLINGIMDDLTVLGKASILGEQVQAALMYKYWNDTPFQMDTPLIKEIKEKKEWKATIKLSSETLTAQEVYLLLNTKSLNNKKTNFMNQKNFEYLRDQVKFTGFGEGLENELKEKMQKQSPEFQITHNTKFGNDDLTASLHFKKSDQTDMYFFNRYQVSLMPEQSKDKMEQTFYINKEGSITLKEAYNLMNARSVNKDLTNKEGQVYNAWMQMDFKQTDNNGNYKLKQFHQNYGYDLVSALEKHPIKELANEQDKTRLVESLQKGNRQSVTFMQNGNEQKHFIEANPQFKTINIYDSNMQRLNSKQGQNEKQGQGEHNSAKQTSKNESPKQGDADDSDEMPKASNKRRKKQSNSIS